MKYLFNLYKVFIIMFSYGICITFIPRDIFNLDITSDMNVIIFLLLVIRVGFYSISYLEDKVWDFPL